MTIGVYVKKRKLRPKPYGRQAPPPTAPDWPSRWVSDHTGGRQEADNPCWLSVAAGFSSRGVPPGSWELPCHLSVGPAISDTEDAPRSSPPSRPRLLRHRLPGSLDVDSSWSPLASTLRRQLSRKTSPSPSPSHAPHSPTVPASNSPCLLPIQSHKVTSPAVCAQRLFIGTDHPFASFERVFTGDFLGFLFRVLFCSSQWNFLKFV